MDQNKKKLQSILDAIDDALVSFCEEEIAPLKMCIDPEGRIWFQTDEDNQPKM